MTICPNTSYKVVFYRTDEDAKEVLKYVFKISDWSCPENPQDLAFFKGNKCWFYSVGHEKIAGIIRADDEDVDFVVKCGLADYSDVEPFNPHYCVFDEEIVKNKGSIALRGAKL